MNALVNIMKKMLKGVKVWGVFLSVQIAVMFCAGVKSLQAESMIHLKSGSTFEGELIREEGDVYIFDISGTEVSLQKSLVTGIVPKQEGESLAEVPASESDAVPEVPEVQDEVSNEDEEEVSSGEKSPEAAPVSGAIKGTIILPKSEGTGKLCVWFVSAVVKEKEISQKYFQVVEPQDITSLEVPFEIPDVPPGEYRGFACWDIAAPQWKESWGKGNFVPLPGDYTGVTENIISVEIGQTVNSVLLECTFFLNVTEVLGEKDESQTN